MIAEWLMKAIFNLVLSHVITLLALVALNYSIYLRGNLTPQAKSYYILCASPALWLIGKIFKTVAPTIALRWAGIVVQYLGMTTIGPSFFVFCLTFLLHKQIRSRTLILLYLPAAVIFALIVSNPLHHWFYPVFTFFRDSFGPVFHINTWTTYTFLAGGGIVLIRELIRGRAAYRGQIVLFVAAAAIPLLASFYYPRLGDIHSGLRFDITPVSFSLSFLCFGIAAFRFRFLDLPRLTFETVAEEMSEAIIVSDTDGSVIYANRVGRTVRPHLRPSVTNGPLTVDDRSYLCRTSVLSTGLTVRYLLDRTDLVERRRRIERRTAEALRLTEDIRVRIDAERETLRINEAIWVAHELHDILGHSLTLVISQLEGLRFVAAPERRLERLARIRRITQSGRDELDASLRGRNTTSLRLVRQLEELATQATTDHCRVELVVRGAEPVMPSDTVRNVYSICRESLTNAVRHGSADHVLISVAFADALSVVIMDNGSGCTQLQDGTGVSGIRHRARQMNAQLVLSSTPDEGFATRLAIPLG